MSDHPDLDASEVEVKVQNGEVILSGTVRERRFKHQLEVLAERISGVNEVRNEIRLQREQQQNETKTSAGQSTSERTTSAGSATSGSSTSASGSTGSLGATSSEPKNNESRRNAS
ncbi:BON domain-containing protein [Sorangium sp. So ce131]|uniref:BON domain-containing protein n=1 Tax=Sorangium sp. So ce131 TaxID=3133282 RepID=UPI003F5FAD25